MSTEPITPERLDEIREAARIGYAITLASLVFDAQTTHPHADGPSIVRGCTVTPADTLKQAIGTVWVKGVPALLAEVDRLRAELDKSRRGGKELGKSVVHLTELIKAAFVKGETDPIAAMHMLGDHLANLFEDEGGLPVEDHNRIYRALHDTETLLTAARAVTRES